MNAHPMQRARIRRTATIAAVILAAPLLAIAAPTVAHAESGAMIIPTSGQVTSVPGEPRPNGRRHNGLDIGAQSGTAVVAAAAGRVVASHFESGVGNKVVLGHAAGYGTEYYHLRTRAVAVGDTVVKGQLIGTVGDTGTQSTGNHLHFEVRLNGVSQWSAFSAYPVGSAMVQGRAIAWSFPGLTMAASNAAPSGSYSTLSAFSPGDFDGDGNADVLRVVTSGELLLYRGDGAGRFASGYGTQVGSGWAAFRSVFSPGDFDGDGFTDVMAITTTGDLYLYRGDGTGGWLSGTGARIGSAWHRFTSVFGPGDFSGDGNADVMAIAPDGTLYLYRGNGAGAWSGSAVIGSSWDGFRAVFGPGDFSGDGNADVIAIAPNGNMYLYRGNGGGAWSGNALIGTSW